MMSEGSTVDRSELGGADNGRRGGRVSGLLRVFGGDTALALPLPLPPRGEALELGRGSSELGPTPDARMSRRHARVHLEGHRVWVTDLGSHNGTSVDGSPLPPGERREVRDVVRMGDSLFVPCADLAAHQQRGVVVHEGFVRGPAMQALLDEATRAAELGLSLHLRGESGTGKEGLARAFHEGGGAARTPFVAVNCAAVPQNLAEALLFGARRGAYSGATDAEGYVAAADGGTLFLDEVAELDLVVQAKLLRVLETREVLALGATRPKAVKFRLCSASHRDLRDEVASGRMREDLYFRLGRPELTLPPLRRRPEEVAFLLEHEVRKVAPGLGAHVSLVEACLLRPWPGNLRELLVEARSAAQTALLRGVARVEARHLSPLAGHAFRAGAPDLPPPSPPARAIAAPSPAATTSDDAWARPEASDAGPRRSSSPPREASDLVPTRPSSPPREASDVVPTRPSSPPREASDVVPTRPSSPPREASDAAPPAVGSPEETPERKVSRAKPLAAAERARIDAVLREVGGNVRAAARLLDVHRTHLRRLIDRGQVSIPPPDPTNETGERDDEPDP